MESLRLMLAALEYPGVDALDPDDQQQFRHLVAWLEGMKVSGFGKKKEGR